MGSAVESGKTEEKLNYYKNNIWILLHNYILNLILLYSIIYNNYNFIKKPAESLNSMLAYAIHVQWLRIHENLLASIAVSLK